MIDTRNARLGIAALETNGELPATKEPAGLSMEQGSYILSLTGVCFMKRQRVDGDPQGGGPRLDWRTQ